ncbi:MAG TPA: DoxX family protein [Prolixibacteraceae bacterium]|nr:DoxX family protein [Bacteroidales bacterium]HNZ72819.1 DoxX family protein [Prolixibacteraceae bacterium]
MNRIKQLFRVNQAPLSTDIALLLIRLFFGGMMLTHGIPKLEMLFSSATVQFIPLFGFSAGFSLALAAAAEAGGAILLIAGLGTRLAAIPMAATMLIAAFVVHANDPLATKELAILYLVAFTALIFAGSGRFSIDRFISQRK